MANRGRGMMRQPAIKSANIQKKMAKNKIAAKAGKKKMTRQYCSNDEFDSSDDLSSFGGRMTDWIKQPLQFVEAMF